jgi:hypothetical protein
LFLERIVPKVLCCLKDFGDAARPKFSLKIPSLMGAVAFSVTPSIHQQAKCHFSQTHRQLSRQAVNDCRDVRFLSEVKHISPPGVFLIKRHRLKVEKRLPAQGPPKLHASEGFHGDAPGKAGQGHNGRADDRISPVR